MAPTQVHNISMSHVFARSIQPYLQKIQHVQYIKTACCTANVIGYPCILWAILRYNNWYNVACASLEMHAHHQLNMTLMAPVLPAAAAVSNPVMTSSCENPNLWVMSGSQSIFFSSRRSRHVGYCIKQATLACHHVNIRSGVGSKSSCLSVLQQLVIQHNKQGATLSLSWIAT